MELPSVDPVGLPKRPAGFRMAPRRYSPAARGVAWLLLAGFGFTVVASTVLSLGAYCLTSDGENTRGLFGRPPVTAPVTPS